MQSIDRSELPQLRETMRNFGMIVAEVDSDLRYVWIDNPHHDFDARQVLGKRDDELISTGEAEDIMRLKREAFETQDLIKRILRFERSDGARYYSLCALPIIESDARVRAIVTIGFDVKDPGNRQGAPA
ncbi:MAG TPA: PAS domain-containing protein [Telluria sp.]